MESYFNNLDFPEIRGSHFPCLGKSNGKSLVLTNDVFVATNQPGSILNALIMWCNDHMQVSFRIKFVTGLLGSDRHGDADLALSLVAYFLQCVLLWYFFLRKESL